jgi:hypothetical protein
VIERVWVLCAALAIATSTMAVHRVAAQPAMELAAHPGIVYPFRSETPSLGGWLGLWVSRTKTVGVGGEVGVFSGGTREWEIQTDDPAFGQVTLNERSEKRLWLVRALVRYRMNRIDAPEASGVLGTGLYALRERLETTEHNPQGELVRSGARTYVSYSFHPGASAGWALGWGLTEDWVLVGDFCLHLIIGAEGVFYPVLVGSIGVGTRL